MFWIPEGGWPLIFKRSLGKIQGQGALTIKPPTVLCNRVSLLPTCRWSNSLCGNELLEYLSWDKVWGAEINQYIPISYSLMWFMLLITMLTYYMAILLKKISRKYKLEWLVSVLNFEEMLKILISSYSLFYKTLGAYRTTVKLTIGKTEQINVKIWNGSGQYPGYPCDKLNQYWCWWYDEFASGIIFAISRSVCYFNNDHSISNQINIKRKSWQNKRFPPKNFKAHRKFINNRKAANVTDLFKKTRHKCSICFQKGWHVSFLLLTVLKCTFYSFCSALISSKKKPYMWRCYGAENGNTSWNNVIMFAFNHVNLHLFLMHCDQRSSK